ncbi:MAG: hypothetical protein ACOZIN_18275 [Myxococcota bacterium]
MSEEKGLGSKLLGIFVETDGNRDRDATEESPAEVVAKLAQTAKPEAPELPPLRLDKVLGPTASAPKDFDAIFRDAGMDGGELDRVKKAEELLKNLPEATPQPVKKQIVEAALKAFGFETEKIIAAAQNQKRALDAYVKVNESSTAKANQDAEMQIRTLDEKISALKADIAKRTASLTALANAASARKTEVQKVVDFFQAPAEPPVT